MAENVAGVLCYLGGWVTGLIFYLIDKRPFVRFHAAQSIVVFGLLNVIYIGIATLFFAGPFRLWGLLALGRLFALALWVVLMVKAFQGERFKLPIVGDWVEQLAARA